MAVSIKSEKEIELMRVSCKNLSVMFDELEKIIKPGISTWEICSEISHAGIIFDAFVTL